MRDKSPTNLKLLKIIQYIRYEFESYIEYNPKLVIRFLVD